jgi:hypothetical protein
MNHLQNFTVCESLVTLSEQFVWRQHMMSSCREVNRNALTYRCKILTKVFKPWEHQRRRETTNATRERTMRRTVRQLSTLYLELMWFRYCDSDVKPDQMWLSTFYSTVRNRIRSQRHKLIHPDIQVPSVRRIPSFIKTSFIGSPINLSTIRYPVVHASNKY